MYNRKDPIFWRKGNKCNNIIEKINYSMCEIVDNHIIKPLKLSPNFITTFSLPFDILSIYLFYKNSYWAAPVLYFALWLDFLDGYTARKHDKETVFGDYYDHGRDTIMTFILFILILVKIYQNKNDYIINTLLFLTLSFITTWGVVKFSEYERETRSKNNETTRILTDTFGKLYDKDSFFIQSNFYTNSTSFFLICIFVAILIHQNKKLNQT